MNMLLAFVLTTHVNALPPCAQRLREIDEKFSDWSEGARTVGRDFEEHTFWFVNKRAVVSLMHVVIAHGPEMAMRELGGYEIESACLMNGSEGALLYKMVRK